MDTNLTSGSSLLRSWKPKGEGFWKMPGIGALYKVLKNKYITLSTAPSLTTQFWAQRRGAHTQSEAKKKKK